MWQLLFGKYYGVDFLAMLLGVISIYSLGQKSRSGFITGFSSSLAWCVVNFWAQIWAGIILNFILIALHIRGYLKWKYEGKIT